MKKVGKNIILCMLVVLSFFIFNKEVMAASYTVSLSSSSVTKGKSTILYIKCSDATGGFRVTSSNSNVASIAGDGTVWCENATETMTITTTIVGSATITVTPISVSDNNGNDVSLSAKSLTLTVSEPVVVKKSSDATLSSLEIEGATLSPKFDKDTLEYTVEMPAETTKVNIKATASDSKASIKGSGEVEVTDGANKIELVVTAEDSTTKTYILVVNVKELNPITVEVDGEEYSVVRKKSDLPELELFDETTVKIGEEEVVAYYNENLKLYVVGLKDKDGNISLYTYSEKENSYAKYNQITVGSTSLYLKDSDIPNSNYKKYKISISNIDTTIYKLKSSDKVGLIYGVNVVTGREGYFVYDKEEESLQRYYDSEVSIYKDKAKEYFTALVVSLGITVIIIISLLLKLIINKNRKKRKHKV
jgi:hypothetical protein